MLSDPLMPKLFRRASPSKASLHTDISSRLLLRHHENPKSTKAGSLVPLGSKNPSPRAAGRLPPIGSPGPQDSASRQSPALGRLRYEAISASKKQFIPPFNTIDEATLPTSKLQDSSRRQSERAFDSNPDLRQALGPLRQADDLKFSRILEMKKMKTVEHTRN